MLVGRRFKAAYGERVYTAIAFAMNEDFGRVLQRQMDVYNSNSADQFAAVQKKLEDVKHVMVTPHTHTLTYHAVRGGGRAGGEACGALLQWLMILYRCGAVDVSRFRMWRWCWRGGRSWSCWWTRPHSSNIRWVHRLDV